jgi:hypothetical protein
MIFHLLSVANEPIDNEFAHLLLTTLHLDVRQSLPGVCAWLDGR